MKKHKEHVEKTASNSLPKLAVLAVLSYVLLFLLGRFFYAWDSPMFFLPPIVGFFFTYFLINWIDDFFETKFSHSLWFPVLILFFSFLAEYIALFWNYNFASFATRNAPMTITTEFFVDSLKNSAFLPFALSCILGWLSHLIIEQTSEGKKD